MYRWPGASRPARRWPSAARRALANGSRSRFDPNRAGRGGLRLASHGAVYLLIVLLMTAIDSLIARYPVWFDEERICPHCGCVDPSVVWANGSAEIQCDNCGFSETE